MDEAEEALWPGEALVQRYLDHVARFGEGRACGCELKSYDEDCDLGVALWRMLRKRVPT